jgi:uncharacterized protein UPF0547
VLRIFGAASTVLGALTALGTVVGWVGSGSFDETVYWAFPLAALIFMYGGGLLPVFGMPYEVVIKRKFRWYTVPYFLLGVVWLAGVVAATGDFFTDEPFRRSFLLPGAIFFGTVLVFAIPLAVAKARRSRKQCPDCAETVKAAARVCRHCGYQWEAPFLKAAAGQREPA